MGESEKRNHQEVLPPDISRIEGYKDISRKTLGGNIFDSTMRCNVHILHDKVRNGGIFTLRTVPHTKFKIDKTFNATEYFNIRDLPLHPTQKLVGEGDGYLDYELTFRPTEDFLGYLLSRSNFVKIISQESLANQLKDMAQSIVNRYNEK